ncbi:MAG: hypothetical protein ACO3V7_04120, partial [Burkholderiaceae bacterium]
MRVFRIKASLVLIATLLPLHGQAQSGDPPTQPTAASPNNEQKAPSAAPQQTNRVEVRGQGLSDDDQRRFSTAAKIVIGREQIEQFGDSSVSEVL